MYCMYINIIVSKILKTLHAHVIYRHIDENIFSYIDIELLIQIQCFIVISLYWVKINNGNKGREMHQILW